MPESEVPKKPEQAIEQAAPPKNADAAEDFAVTIDQFMTSVQSAGMRSLRSMLSQFMEKADAVITKLDVDAGGPPAKKQEKADAVITKLDVDAGGPLAKKQD